MTTQQLERIKNINRKYRFYHYLELNREIGKCVVMITDRQLVFAPAVKILENDHWLLTRMLLEAIGLNPDNENEVQAIFVTALCNELTVELPEQTSPTQIALMDRLFADFELYRKFLGKKYDNEEELMDRFGLQFLFLDDGITKDNLKDELLKRVSLEKITPEEIIIGSTLTTGELEAITREIEHLLSSTKSI